MLHLRKPHSPVCKDNGRRSRLSSFTVFHQKKWLQFQNISVTLWCHCNLVHNNFLYLSNPAVAVIFPNLCWWQRTLCSNTGGIDPEKKTIEPHLKSSFLILSYQDFSVALWAGGGIDCSFLLMRMIFSIHCSYSAFILASVRKQVAICHLINERRLGWANLRKAFWDCYCWSR